jgi:hypothetical protein
MLRRYRQRRGPYALAKQSVVPSFIRSIVLLLIACTVLYFIGRGILALFGMGGSSDERTPVTFTIEDQGTVNVSLEGGLMQRGDSTMKLFASDKISAAGNGHARLQFFDSSWIRTNISTDLSIDKSSQTTKSSVFQVTLTKGDLWINTPAMSGYSGAIVRTIVTPSFTAVIPADTQAMIDSNDLLVFSADGDGISVTLKGSKTAENIGEGQQMILPDTPTGDPLHYRSAIDPLAAQKPFVQQSRQITRTGNATTTGTGSTAAIDPNSIVVDTPTEGAVISGQTVTVSGKVGANVNGVRINGHLATIDRTNQTGATTTDLEIDAIDTNDIVLDQVTRSVKKAVETIKSPTITNPAGNGQTYRTQDVQIEIKGTASAGAAGIMVNDYKLQLFRTGDTTWSYLASKALNNLVDGKNIFNVYALDADGNPSAPATVTVLVEAGTVGLVSTGSTVSGNTASAPAVIDEKTLPQNAPTTPGVITVTGPAAGASFTATGSEILIEGTTSAQTESVWINGYKLQLYKPGKTLWNYIAKTDFGTLKKGTNVYTIHARDKANNILDSFTYTVTY